MIRELPNCVGDRGPDHHGAKGIMLRAFGRAVANSVNGWKAGLLEGRRCQMHEAVKSYWRHEVDEKTVGISEVGQCGSD